MRLLDRCCSPTCRLAQRTCLVLSHNSHIDRQKDMQLNATCCKQGWSSQVVPLSCVQSYCLYCFRVCCDGWRDTLAVLLLGRLESLPWRVPAVLHTARNGTRETFHRRGTTPEVWAGWKGGKGDLRFQRLWVGTISVWHKNLCAHGFTTNYMISRGKSSESEHILLFYCGSRSCTARGISAMLTVQACKQS